MVSMESRQPTHSIKEQGGVNCCAFDTTFDKGSAPHKIIDQIKYDWSIPFFSLKTFGIYGFSMGISRSELKYILPFPSRIPAHDTYIAYSARWRHKLHFINHPCALHRFMADSASALKKRHDPLLIKILFRVNIYFSVIWRSLIIR